MKRRPGGPIIQGATWCKAGCTTRAAEHSFEATRFSKLPAEFGPGMYSKIPFRVVELRADGSRQVLAMDLTLDGAEWIKRIRLAMDPTCRISIETHLPIASEALIPSWPPVGVPARHSA